MDYFQESLKLHKMHKGKISIESKIPLESAEDLSLAYTPGVAQPCIEISKDQAKAYDYTIKGNTVAIVSDGSAVLGLGNIGAKAAIPVMEGKALLFKNFGHIDAFPICVDTQDTEEIIKTVKRIAPVFGGINLEDISAPKCFEIEERLQKELDIPVFHDDQHGTAIVTTAALLNALKIVNKKLDTIKVVLNGPGAAGTAIIKMLYHAGVRHIIACDSKGVLYKSRPVGMTPAKRALCDITNPGGIKGDLSDAIIGADVFIGVSVAGALTKEMIATMATDPIVFALANPTPEIMYDEAIECGVKVMGTGRSDFPNQINNVLAFPGIFRGALDVKARVINSEMKFAAAAAIANLVSEEELSPEYIIPSVFDRHVSPAVARAVAIAAAKSGVARK